MAEFQIPREYSDGKDLLKDKEIDAVSIGLPNHMHAPMALAALRAGKHVLCEKPPATSAAEARRMEAAAKNNGKVLLYSLQRRFGPHEQAAKAAVSKGYVGDVYHVRAVWTRTRGIPVGTGWFTQKEKSGGGALMDVGFHMLDLGWYLLGQPRPQSAFGASHSRFGGLISGNHYDVDDASFGIVRFEGGKSLELAASWALNQPPQQNGTTCRLYGSEGAIEVYTPNGAVLYRDFNGSGECKENPLKPPKSIHHVALMRHFKDCIAGRATANPGGGEGIILMQMVQAIYKSSATGRSVQM
jgi:predicted dehydrogenase